MTQRSRRERVSRSVHTRKGPRLRTTTSSACHLSRFRRRLADSSIRIRMTSSNGSLPLSAILYTMACLSPKLSANRCSPRFVTVPNASSKFLLKARSRAISSATSFVTPPIQRPECASGSDPAKGETGMRATLYATGRSPSSRSRSPVWTKARCG